MVIILYYTNYWYDSNDNTIGERDSVINNKIVPKNILMFIR